MRIVASTGLVLLLAFIISGFTTGCTGKRNDQTAIRIEADNPYLGEIPPDDEPVIFAPGIISTPNLIEMGITFSSDGREIYFSRSAGPEISSNFSIWICREGKNGWETPQVASFSTHRDFAPFMMPNGRRFLFSVRTDRIPNTKTAPMLQRETETHGVSRYSTMKPTASPLLWTAACSFQVETKRTGIF